MKKHFPIHLTLACLCALLPEAHAQSASLDATFDPGTGVAGGNFPLVYGLSPQSDGKIIVAGTFTNYNGAFRRNLVRVNGDGSLDASYDAGMALTSASADVYTSTLQTDGKLLIGGTFTNIAGRSQSGIARFNTDGSVDNSFRPAGIFGSGFPYVFRILMQPDGKILVGGVFSGVNGNTWNSIARLNADGTSDTSFDPGGGITTSTASGVFGLGLQPDGKILVGGRFTNIVGVARNHIARLNANGSLDSSFNPGTGLQRSAFPAANFIIVQPDSKILVGGMFDSVNGIARNSIARLNSDGSVDQSFNPGSGVTKSGSSSAVNSMILFADGRILLAGSFDTVNGAARSGIALLSGNGDLDPGFNPGTGVSGTSTPFLHIVALQPDGKTVIGGHFTAFDGTARNNIARLGAGAPTVEPWKLFGPRKIGNRFEVSALTKVGRNYTLQYREQVGAGDWTSLAPVAGDGTVKVLADENATSNSRFYRGRED